MVVRCEQKNKTLEITFLAHFAKPRDARQNPSCRFCFFFYPHITRMKYTCNPVILSILSLTGMEKQANEITDMMETENDGSLYHNGRYMLHKKPEVGY